MLAGVVYPSTESIIKQLNFGKSDYSKHYLSVNSADRTEYNDTIKYQEYKYYSMISNGSFVSIPKPDNLNK